MQPTQSLQKLVRVEASTWSRDSHDLFDYEATPSFTKSLLIAPPSKILRCGTDVYSQRDDNQENFQVNSDHLLSIRAFCISVGEKLSVNFEVSPAEKNSHGMVNKKLWIIVRYLPARRYIIQENDIIKLGRCKLKVKQLITPQGNLPLKLDEFPSIEANQDISEMSNLQCRICLMDGGTIDDPLVRACACRGTIEYIHVSCLKRWIIDKLSYSLEQSKNSYCLKLVRCELCKQSFPIVIKRKDGETIKLFQIPSEILVPPLIVLENLIGSNPRAYHIISIRNQVKLGRGHECDVRISDVSISRHHATISYHNGDFIIEDHDSKFGTLVSLKHPLPITDSKQLTFQAGRSVLSLQLLDSNPNKSDAIRESAPETGRVSHFTANT